MLLPNLPIHSRFISSNNENVLFTDFLYGDSEEEENVLEVLENLIHHLIMPNNQNINERLLVVKGNLILEIAINHFMDELGSEPEINLYSKIEFLLSLNLIPKGLWEVAKLLNSIRNKLSHNLDKEGFDDLEGKMGNLRGYFSNFYPNEENKYNNSELYLIILFATCFNIMRYSINIKYMQKFIREDNFKVKLKKQFDLQ